MTRWNTRLGLLHPTNRPKNQPQVGEHPALVLNRLLVRGRELQCLQIGGLGRGVAVASRLEPGAVALAPVSACALSTDGNSRSP